MHEVNLATLLALAVVIAVTLYAAFCVIRMVRKNDMCYACPNKGQCCSGNPINCTLRKED